MKEQTKLTVAVSVGTMVIELGLFLILCSVFLTAMKIVTRFDQQVGAPEKGLLIASLLAGIVLLCGVYNKTSDYLRSRMCWALVRRFHGKA